MSHRRVKDIAYDDDDFYDDDEYADDGGEEMSEEDKEQMRQGTIKVREALGSEYSNVSNKQIEEALWNYYYDIGKSVSYLKSEPTRAMTDRLL